MGHTSIVRGREWRRASLFAVLGLALLGVVVMLGDSARGIGGMGGDLLALLMTGRNQIGTPSR